MPITLAIVKSPASQSSLWLGLLLPGLTLFGCSKLPQAANQVTLPLPALNFGGTITPVKDVQQHSQENSPIYLKGRIGQQVPLLGGRVYELQDQTGTVWVLTRENPPAQGDEVLIKGQVRYKSIPLAGKEQGSLYVEQQQQLQHHPQRSPSQS